MYEYDELFRGISLKIWKLTGVKLTNIKDEVYVAYIGQEKMSKFALMHYKDLKDRPKEDINLFWLKDLVADKVIVSLVLGEDFIHPEESFDTEKEYQDSIYSTYLQLKYTGSGVESFISLCSDFIGSSILQTRTVGEDQEIKELDFSVYNNVKALADIIKNKTKFTYTDESIGKVPNFKFDRGIMSGRGYTESFELESRNKDGLVLLVPSAIGVNIKYRRNRLDEFMGECIKVMNSVTPEKGGTIKPKNVEENKTVAKKTAAKKTVAKKTVANKAAKKEVALTKSAKPEIITRGTNDIPSRYMEIFNSILYYMEVATGRTKDELQHKHYYKGESRIELNTNIEPEHNKYRARLSLVECVRGTEDTTIATLIDSFTEEVIFTFQCKGYRDILDAGYLDYLGDAVIEEDADNSEINENTIRFREACALKIGTSLFWELNTLDFEEYVKRKDLDIMKIVLDYISKKTGVGYEIKNNNYGVMYEMYIGKNKERIGILGLRDDDDIATCGVSRILILLGILCKGPSTGKFIDLNKFVGNCVKAVNEVVKSKEIQGDIPDTEAVEKKVVQKRASISYNNTEKVEADEKGRYTPEEVLKKRASISYNNTKKVEAEKKVYTPKELEKEEGSYTKIVRRDVDNLPSDFKRDYDEVLNIVAELTKLTKYELEHNFYSKPNEIDKSSKEHKSNKHRLRLSFVACIKGTEETTVATLIDSYKNEAVFTFQRGVWKDEPIGMKLDSLYKVVTTGTSCYDVPEFARYCALRIGTSRFWNLDINDINEYVDGDANGVIKSIAEYIASETGYDVRAVKFENDKVYELSKDCKIVKDSFTLSKKSTPFRDTGDVWHIRLREGEGYNLAADSLMRLEDFMAYCVYTLECGNSVGGRKLKENSVDEQVIEEERQPKKLTLKISRKKEPEQTEKPVNRSLFRNLKASDIQHDNTTTIVALKHEEKVVAFRFKCINGGMDIDIDSAKQIGISKYRVTKVEKIIAYKGVLLSKVEYENKVLYPNISNDEGLCRQLLMEALLP